MEKEWTLSSLCGSHILGLVKALPGPCVSPTSLRTPLRYIPFSMGPVKQRKAMGYAAAPSSAPYAGEGLAPALSNDLCLMLALV